VKNEELRIKSEELRVMVVVFNWLRQKFSTFRVSLRETPKTSTAILPSSFLTLNFSRSTIFTTCCNFPFFPGVLLLKKPPYP
jgi:hypothetical protein